MNKSLYQIGSEWLELEAMLEESGGELTPEIEAMLNQNTQELETKCENIVSYMRYFESLADTAKQEENRIKELKKFYENSANSLKKHLEKTLPNIGKEKIETGRFRLSFRKSESIEVDENETAKISTLPDKYLKIEAILNNLNKEELEEIVTKYVGSYKKSTLSVDKTELKKAIKDGTVTKIDIENKKDAYYISIDGIIHDEIIFKENKNLQIK